MKFNRPDGFNSLPFAWQQHVAELESSVKQHVGLFSAIQPMFIAMADAVAVGDMEKVAAALLNYVALISEIVPREKLN